MLAFAGTLLSSCDDFLDDHRYPLTAETSSPEFWNNSDNVTQETNRLFNYMPGFGDFYFNTLSDDQAGRLFGQSEALTNGQNWYFTAVPSQSNSSYTDWLDLYQVLRHAAYIIQNVGQSSMEESVKNNFIGIGRLNRAWFTYQLVKRYGNVIWIDKVVDLDDESILYGEREDRDAVMDKVLEDLDYAVANISTQSATLDWSKDLANAMKAEICLYEGTYCKYRTAADNAGKGPDTSRAEKYLTQAANAAEALMNGSYTLASDPASIYQTMNVSSFTGNSEIIFGKAYAMNVLNHSTIAYTCSSTQICGMSRDAFESFLFKDGLPLALTSCDTNDEGYMKTNADGITYYYIGDVLANRDNRLTLTTDTVSYCKGMTWKRWGAGDMDATTGYGVRKYDNVDMEAYYRMTIGQNYTCAPIFWLSYIYCIYAEAKAELGTIAQSDLDKSINLLYARAGLPNLQLAGIFNDPANNMGVSSIIWEVRRCRRCELMFDRDLRYWDLIRWHQLDKLDSTKYPNTLTGANMKGSTVWANQDGSLNFTADGYLDGALGVRTYDNKYYFYPIPSNQLTLNSNLTQNPGWN